MIDNCINKEIMEANVIMNAIDNLVKSNTNGIVDDFNSLKELMITLELNKEKEKKICISVPLTISFNWYEGVNGFCYNDYNQDTVDDIISTIQNGFEAEMNNNITKWIGECDKYAEKHHIDNESFSEYFFLKYAIQTIGK